MNRLENDHKTIAWMIAFYCRRKHGTQEGLCPECTRLLAYAKHQIDHCVMGEDKGACRDCIIKCFRPKEREAIRKVMRYSGARIFFYHPIDTIRHLF